MAATAIGTMSQSNGFQSRKKEDVDNKDNLWYVFSSTKQKKKIEMYRLSSSHMLRVTYVLNNPNDHDNTYVPMFYYRMRAYFPFNFPLKIFHFTGHRFSPRYRTAVTTNCRRTRMSSF